MTSEEQKQFECQKKEIERLNCHLESKDAEINDLKTKIKELMVNCKRNEQ